jgi:hypothetical protein
MPSQVGHCDEEFWHHLFLFSRFQSGNESLRKFPSKSPPNSKLEMKNYTFPSKIEQGNCPTYVYWDDYLEKSPFRSDVQMLHARDMSGQHIIHPHLSFLSDLRQSKSFYFLRKMVDIGNNTFLPQRMKNGFLGFRNESSERFISLLEAITYLRIFD